jgi:hypothetical protein
LHEIGKEMMGSGRDSLLAHSRLTETFVRMNPEEEKKVFNESLTSNDTFKWEVMSLPPCLGAELIVF